MKNDNPKVSVVVPVYNVEKYVGECLDSLINQTLKDIEIICVNDGTTDGSLDILEEYAKKDERIKIITQPNQGLAAARNTGIRNVTGDYVLFIDSDDYFDTTGLEKLYNNAISNGSDAVLFKLARFKNDDPEKIEYRFPGFKLEEVFPDADFDNFTFTYRDIKYYVLEGIFSACVKLYKKEFLDSHPDMLFPEGLIYEDVPFHVKVMLLSERLSFVPEFFYFYRTNPQSITQSTNKSTDIYIIVGLVEEFLRENGFYEEFKEEFAGFKITEFTRYIINAKSETFYTQCKEELPLLEGINEDIIQTKYTDRFHILNESESYVDFLSSYSQFTENRLKTKADSLNQQNINLKNQINRLNNEKNRLIEDKDNLNQEKERLNNKLKSLEDENKAQKQKIESLNEFNQSILNSKSWKVTKPLRSFSNMFK